MKMSCHPEQSWRLKQIYFYLTRACNLRCRHCWIAPGIQKDGQSSSNLDLDLFRSIVEQAKPFGLTAVKLTGGEPLIHPRIYEIIQYVRGQDLRLSIETNGVFCDSGMARAIGRCENVAVSVSLDAADPATHEWMRGVEGSFEDAIHGIHNLVEAGIRPQIIMSLVRRNKSQMGAVVRLAEKMGASSVKFNLVQPTARGELLHRSGETLSIDELVELGRWVERQLSVSASVRVVYSHPAAFRPLGKMFGKDGDGCAECGILGILGVLADGNYALCGIGETVQDLVFGHAAGIFLEEVWNHAPVLRQLRAGLPASLAGICSRCLMKSICLGSCIAQNYYRSRSLWAPFWYCEEAAKRGLFPNYRSSSALPAEDSAHTNALSNREYANLRDT